MCFHSKQSKSAQQLEHRFNAKFKQPNQYQPSIYNAFDFPKIPIITNNSIATIQMSSWGLIPSWAKDNSIKKYTLNARIETITEKPSFKNVTHNRCLVLSDGFYEWQWLDEKGKEKQKYLITLPNDELFAFGGLFSEWLDKQTGELLHTFTILTTEANELMSKIHNTKKRMPVIVANENDFLSGKDLIMNNDKLIGTKI